MTCGQDCSSLFPFERCAPCQLYVSQLAKESIPLPKELVDLVLEYMDPSNRRSCNKESITAEWILFKGKPTYAQYSQSQVVRYQEIMSWFQMLVDKYLFPEIFLPSQPSDRKVAPILEKQSVDLFFSLVPRGVLFEAVNLPFNRKCSIEENMRDKEKIYRSYATSSQWEKSKQ